jgi:hypothetical protein
VRPSVHRVKEAIAHRPIRPLPRGELWLGTGLFKRAGVTDTLENHFRLVTQLGQDMICLPIADNTSDKPALGYRYFKYTELKDATRHSDRFVTAVLDGPFQELVNRMGLMAGLTAWVRKRQEFISAYEMEQAKVLELTRKCLDQGVDALVIADDFAADQAPFISPTDIQTLCTPFYTQAVMAIHEASAAAFLHSCGNLTLLIPLIKAWRLDGLAAVQHRAIDLITLHQAFDFQLTIMAGIEAELLVSDVPSPGALNEFERIVGNLAPLGGLILSSCCGLYSGDFLGRIENIYAFADYITKNGYSPGRG